MRYSIALFLTVVFLVGCQFGCISLAGTYKDFGGEVTWCQDKQATQDAQRNVLSNENGNSATLVTDEEILKINEALEAKISAAGIQSVSDKGLLPIERFSKLIRKIDLIK